MKDFSWWVVFFVIALETSSCAKAEQQLSERCFEDFENCIFISGKLDQGHIDLVAENGPDADVVLVTSAGGQAGYGMQLGQLLGQYKLPIVIAGECSSACAEFLMPSANYVIILGQPRIAFHGNPLISRDIARERGLVIADHCWPSLQYLEHLYTLRSLNYEFVERQRAYTGDPDIGFVEKSDGCLFYSHYSPPKTEWLPSVEMMRDLWGLDIREHDQ